MKKLLILLLIIAALVALDLLSLWTLSKHLGFKSLAIEIILTGISGGLLIMSCGMMVWRRTWLSLLDRKLPSREVVKGLVVYAAGTGLALPGVASDALAVALLVKPVRRLAAHFVSKQLEEFLSRGGLQQFLRDKID